VFILEGGAAPISIPPAQLKHMGMSTITSPADDIFLFIAPVLECGVLRSIE
jgi:hypothetical protein